VRVLLRSVQTLVLLTGLVAPLLAQPGAPAAQDGFEPVSKLPAVEHLPAAPLVIGAYAFIWVALLAYVFFLWRKLATVDRELASLRQAIDRQH